MKIKSVEAFGISVDTRLTAMVTHPNYTALTIVRSYSPDHYTAPGTLVDRALEKYGLSCLDNWLKMVY